jgi:hypothetical protein
MSIRTALVPCALILGCLSTLLTAQTAPSGVFFHEGWESGGAGASFNSSAYGSLSGNQFSVQGTLRAAGSFALRHRQPAGTTGASTQYATQHFGDALTGPVLPAGQGAHFQDMYLQWKVYYAPGFDFSTDPKQLIIGTQDDRRHDNVCCNPWVSHYVTITTYNGAFQAEGNNKRAPSGQWLDLGPNMNGYSTGSNPFRVQTGRWYTIEVRRRLNDAGQSNGIFEMWIDGLQITRRTGLELRVPWNGTVGANYAFGTNFAMISDWLDGSSASAEQSIYYDDVRFSTTYMGSSAGAGPEPPRNLRIIS